jgi:DNA-binding ferritin-like protein
VTRNLLGYSTVPADGTKEYTDDVAERANAIGISPNGKKQHWMWQAQTA